MPGRCSKRSFWRGTTALTGATAAILFAGAAFAQSGPIHYGFAGADGTCCHDGNGYDGSPGQRDFTQADRNLNVSSSAAGQTAVTVDVRGGNGGNATDFSNFGGNGGSATQADYTIAASSIRSAGYGIDVFAGGGNGGRWAFADAGAGWGLGGAGNNARLTLQGVSIVSVGYGVLLQSAGGTGADGAFSSVGRRDGGTGGQARDASVSLQGSTSITVQGTAGTAGAAVAVNSIGGNGGSTSANGIFDSFSSYAGNAGSAGAVLFSSERQSSITTTGNDIHGLAARSLGGNASLYSSPMEHAGAGGNSGTVTVANWGTIATAGDRSIGIVAVSQGGNGGAGGRGALGSGYAGGPGGTAGAITLSNSGLISTGTPSSIGAHGVLVQLIGGAGGPGGPGGDTGSGGDGGAGGISGGGINIDNSGTIQTAGKDASGLIAHAVGGGGGQANSSAGAFFIGGGNGGQGGQGGNITLANDGMISSQGDHSAAVILQSIGGGGGTGGDANANGAVTSIAIGGSGGAAGSGAKVLGTSSGSIITTGSYSTGVTLQSIGGGGGNGGSGNVLGGGIGIGVTLAMGGNGGAGGDGGAATFVNWAGATVRTAGVGSSGILTQSIGGGGGSGGFANSDVIAIAPPSPLPTGTISAAITLGGSGAGGGSGSVTGVANYGSITTAGAFSNGITSQSIGGGGGNGGAAFAALNIPTIGNANLTVGVTVRNGGSAGLAGNGGPVDVQNSSTGTVSTTGTGSVGILAQSVGGGGGAGGFVQELSMNSFNAIVGSAGALVSAAEALANALKGGLSLKFNPSLNATVAVSNGGNGGAGGSGGVVTIQNDGRIATAGAYAHGIVAQSIGGGGGQAGTVDAISTSTLLSNIFQIGTAILRGVTPPSLGNVSFSYSHRTGGTGGSGGDGFAVSVTNTGPVVTTGMGAAGIIAMSVGGGGGVGSTREQSVEEAIRAAAPSSAAEILGEVATIMNYINLSLQERFDLNVGGQDGSAGKGASVSVDASASSILTGGGHAPGIVGQSIGGGGGYSSGSHMGVLTLRLGGRSDAISNDDPSVNGGGQVTVQGGTGIQTTGVNAPGVIAQSIGGGGGVSTSSGSGDFVVSQNQKYTIGLGGTFAGNGWANASGNVSVSINGSIATSGALSHGVLAQSIGGGGGTAIVSAGTSTEAPSITLGMQAADSSSRILSPGGSVQVGALGFSSQIATTGNSAFGILAQSIGAGGGYVGLDDTRDVLRNRVDITFGSGGLTVGSGGPVTVTQGSSDLIRTLGTNAHAIVAQSVGGGGGIAGLALAPDLTRLMPLDHWAGWSTYNNAGGSVNVVAVGNIQTSGNGAIGILAQSVSGSGGIAGDASSGSYGLDMIKPVAIVGGGGSNGGDVTVEVGGSVVTRGANAPAILAMSLGGGGVFLDGQIYQFTPPAGDASKGGAVNVTIDQGATVAASGANSPAIVALSTGTQLGTVFVTVATDATVRADMTTGTAILAPVGVTVNNSGTIGARTAVSSSGTAYVSNSGTIQGDVAIGVGWFRNLAGGVFETGTNVVTPTLSNQGTLNPGGAGVFQTTRINGSLQQSTGIYAPDVDFSGSRSDLISVSGSSTFGGVLAPVLQNPVKGVWLSIAQFDAPQSSVPTTQSSNPLFTYNLRNSDPADGWRNPQVSVEFAPKALPASQDRANVAAHLQSVWDTGDPKAASLFNRFVGVQNAGDYQAALDRVMHDGQFARSANQVHESFASMNRMMSCPVFVGEGALLRESECMWGRVGTNWVNRSATANDVGFRIRQTTLQFGLQRELAPDWFAAASFSYGHGVTSSSGATASSDTFSGGAALKRVIGPWQFSAAVHGGYETLNARRTTLDGTATSHPRSAFVAGRLRAAYEFDMKAWYVRPYLDLDVNHVSLFKYRESSAGQLHLHVLGSDHTSFMATPMLEIGGRTDLGGMTLRSYVGAGVSFLAGGHVKTAAKLSEFDGMPFSVATAMPKTFGNLSAGLELVARNGLELKAEYAVRAHARYIDQSLSLRAAYRF